MSDNKRGRPEKSLDDDFKWEILMKIRAGAKTAKEAGTSNYYLNKPEMRKYIEIQTISNPKKVGRPKNKLAISEEGKLFIENYKVPANAND